MYNNQGPHQQYPAGGYPNSPPYPTYEGGNYPKPNYNNSGYPPYPNPGYPTYGNPNPGPRGDYPATMSASYASPGEDPNAAFDFTEKTIRLAFIRKVYSLLTLQLLIVVGFVGLFLFEKKLQKFVSVHFELLIIALVVSFVLLIALSCCDNVRRTSPMNYICLFTFTIAFSFLVGVSAAHYNAQEVLLAMGMTAAITIGLTIFAFQTKIDFTVCGGGLLALLIVLIIGGIFAAFFPSKIMNTVIAGFGAFLMSLYIVFDTQLMIGGNHTYSISPEEYVFAALNLYLDIVNLFLYILRLIGGRD